MQLLNECSSQAARIWHHHSFALLDQPAHLAPVVLSTCSMLTRCMLALIAGISKPASLTILACDLSNCPLGLIARLKTGVPITAQSQMGKQSASIDCCARHYINAKHDHWDRLLPMVRFALNNAHFAMTGSTPFCVCFGKHPRTPMQEVVDLAREQWREDPAQRSAPFPTVHEYTVDKQEIVRLA